ncbi:hypothetical protein [Bosea sp. NBC_00550]|uniref:hypothetical protein n=1 Tax=Bosea sp. NBC_00550 TaxID=2969621 RepID=UPI002230D2D5|nr:hypothetical protein [Bosea sp. NBC_00550]UZF94451.1 hypothetical protein NWE53_09865 [Bosea sp. NBC_00550]
MNAIILPLTGAVAMAAISPDLGWQVHLVLLTLLVLMQGTGLLICRVFGQTAEPFLALTLGFVAIAHALFASDVLIPGGLSVVAAFFVAPAALGFALARHEDAQPPIIQTVGLTLLASLYTFLWAADIGPRMRVFHTKNEFPFWSDGLLHAASLAQFSAPAEVGRGMVYMADMPRAIYHYVSYLPAALLPAIAGVSPIDATMLSWLPFGIFIMACGVAALGLVLEGPFLAAAALMAIAAVPDTGRFGFGNGLFCFDWLLETAPGTAYSLGVACAALAVLVRWMRDQRPASLLLALTLTASCALVRLNTFVWLAPTVALGAVVGWRHFAMRSKQGMTLLGLLGLVLLLAALSSQALRTDAGGFLFSYIEFAHRDQGPANLQGFVPSLQPHIGRWGAGLVGVGFALMETAGWWLPLFVVLSLVIRRQGRLEAVDSLPWILLAVAALMMLLAPTPPDGDFSEFRHRAGPLLVVILAIWTLRLGAIAAAGPMARTPTVRGRVAIVAAAILSLCFLNITISAAKRPRMAWGKDFYDQHVPNELVELAPLLSTVRGAKPRFVVARQSPNSRNTDDAAHLVALSGVPAYISRPQSLLVAGGARGEEARRRLAVLDRLNRAPDLEALQNAMRAEGITYYIVSSARDAPFDSERHAAIGHQGEYAIYSAK